MTDIGATNVIHLGDYSSLSKLKISGTVTPLPSSIFQKTVSGNHCKISDIWITDAGYGIECGDKVDVVIERVILTNLRNDEDWAAGIHVVGTAVFINDVYITDSNRGIEIEDGAKNVFASHGYIKTIKNYNATGHEALSLDVHVHEGTGGVDNVFFNDFYLEDCNGMTAKHGGPGVAEADMPRNVHFENITIKNMKISMTLNGYFITLKNIRVVDTGNVALFRWGTGAKTEQVIIDGLTTYNYTPDTIPITISDVNNVVLKNVKIPYYALCASSKILLFVNSPHHILVENCEFTDFSGVCAPIQMESATISDVTIRNCRVSMDAVSPGACGINVEGSNIKIENNAILGSPTTTAIKINGSYNYVHENYIENSSILIHNSATNAKVRDNILANGNIEDNGANSIWFKPHSDLFMDVLAASANHVHAAIAGTGAEQEITTAITNPDNPRNISITNSANSTGDVKIDGVDAKGNTVSDTITIVTGGIAYGVVAFATVSKITIPATVANPDTISVGISDKLGLSNIIYASGDVYKVKVNNADDPTIGTVNTTYDTVDCATINAGDDITIWYKSNLNLIA